MILQDSVENDTKASSILLSTFLAFLSHNVKLEGHPNDDFQSLKEENHHISCWSEKQLANCVDVKRINKT